MKEAYLYICLYYMKSLLFPFSIQHYCFRTLLGGVLWGVIGLGGVFAQLEVEPLPTIDETILLDDVEPEENNQPKAPAILQYDQSSPLKNHSFAPDKLARFRAQKDFQYEPKPIAPSENLLIRWAQKVLEWLYKPSIGKTRNVDIVAYIIIFLALILIIKSLFKLQFQGLFRKKAQPNQGILLYQEEENIHEMDIKLLKKEAVATANYRKATRYLYLETLKQLNDKAHIQWQPSKTNYHYLQEVLSKHFYQDFKMLTLLFDYVWYGEFILDKERYDRIEQDFLTFNRRLEEHL